MTHPTTTKAVVFESKLSVVVRDVAIPAPSDDDIVVETAYSWISPGTELSCLRGERVSGEVPVTRGSPVPFPDVCGYQKIGRVVHVGKNVTEFKTGQLVFTTIGGVEDMYNQWGGQLRLSITNAQQVYAIPQTDDPIAFSGAVLTQVGFNCGNRPTVATGDHAVVIGDGLVGHWAAQTLQQRGAGVTLIGRNSDRLERFDAGPDDRVVEVARDQSPQASAARVDSPIDVLIDTVGSRPMLEAFLPNMTRQGQIVSAGFYHLDDKLAVPLLRPAELSVHMVSGWTRERLETTIDWIGKGKLQTRPLITHTLPVDQAPHAYDILQNRKENALGVILDWTEA